MNDRIESADLFCGSGGTSSGLIDACAELGIPLHLIAINHWEIAIETHSANHPTVQHYCSDLEDIDPREVVPGGHLRLLVASPECTHFSNARGGEPVTNQNRASIKYVLHWLSALDVDDVLIENVPEFRHWGPLHRKGPLSGRPIAKRKGEYFTRFLTKLRALGYRAEHRVLCAADYGDATSRRRLFIRARKGNRPITWPEPSHAAKTKTLFGELKPYRTARDILDLTRKGESIFNRKKPKKPLSENTMRRIYAGLRKFSGLPFVLPPEGIFRGNTARSVDDPLQTVTAQRGAGHVVEPFLVGVGGPKGQGRPASVDEPMRSVLGTNHQAIVQPFIVAAGGQEIGAASVDDPLGTVLARNNRAVVQPYLVALGQTGGNGDRTRSVDQPVPTIVSKQELALAEPFIVKYYEGSDAVSVDEPLPTVTAEYEHLAVAQPYLIKLYGTSEAGPVDDPLPTVTGDGQHIALAQPYLVEFHGGDTGDDRSKSVDQPLPTQDTSNRFGVAQPYVLAIRGGDDGYTRSSSVDEPMPTVTGSAPFALIQPQFEKFIVQMEHSSEKSGDDRRVYDAGRPLPTITSSAHFGVVELEPFIVKYYGSSDAVSVDQPLDTITAVERFGLAVPVQNGWAIVDILFRMLDVDELARAHSMDDYKFKGTKKDMVKQIGNSVPRRLAQALCRAALES